MCRLTLTNQQQSRSCHQSIASQLRLIQESPQTPPEDLPFLKLPRMLDDKSSAGNLKSIFVEIIITGRANNLGRPVVFEPQPSDGIKLVQPKRNEIFA